jgi:hypothetical protein
LSNKLHIDFDSQNLMYQHTNGYHAKDLLALHETISHDGTGIADELGVEKYLAQKNYGIHGVVDKEGLISWAKGLGNAIFWQCGGVNTRSIGIEQVSYIPVQYKDNVERRQAWNHREVQLNAVAKLIACIVRAHPAIKLVYSRGTLPPGITAHWNVSQIFSESLGHTDCWPVKEKGYYPIENVITLAKQYYKEGWHF